MELVSAIYSKSFLGIVINFKDVMTWTDVVFKNSRYLRFRISYPIYFEMVQLDFDNCFLCKYENTFVGKICHDYLEA